MAKIVLEIGSNREPKQDDILVYNSVLKIWEYKSKADYLRSVNKGYLECQKEIQEVKKDIKQLFEDEKELAKIMKEGIK